MKEVEHRVAALRIIVVAVGQENSDVDRTLQRRGADVHVQLSGIELLDRLDVDTVAVAELGGFDPRPSPAR